MILTREPESMIVTVQLLPAHNAPLRHGNCGLRGCN